MKGSTYVYRNHTCIGMATYDSCHVTVFSSNSNESWVRLWNCEIRIEQSEVDNVRYGRKAKKSGAGLTVAGGDYQDVIE